VAGGRRHIVSLAHKVINIEDIGLMQSLLARSIRIWTVDVAARIRKYDPGVLLGVALCFTPAPPSMLLGIMLSTANLLVARPGELSRSELRLIWTGIAIATIYVIIWGILGFWAYRNGVLSQIVDNVRGVVEWVLQPILSRSPHVPHTSPFSQRI